MLPPFIIDQIRRREEEERLRDEQQPRLELPIDAFPPKPRPHVRALYDEVCRHYGLRIGLKHARKHLGWALEIAAQCSHAPAETLKGWRQKILTSEDPHRVHRSLQDAFDDFAWSAAA
jgi:tRNA-dihydrouridine synthase